MSKSKSRTEEVEGGFKKIFKGMSALDLQKNFMLFLRSELKDIGDRRETIKKALLTVKDDKPYSASEAAAYERGVNIFRKYSESMLLYYKRIVDEMKELEGKKVPSLKPDAPPSSAPKEETPAEPVGPEPKDGPDIKTIELFAEEELGGIEAMLNECDTEEESEFPKAPGETCQDPDENTG